MMETRNDFFVGLSMDGTVVILRPPVIPMTKAEALRLAAWLVIEADDHGDFPKVLDAVQNSY